MTSEGRWPLPCSAPKLSFQSWATVALSALLSMPTAQGAFMQVVLLTSQGRTTVPCQSPSLLLEWVRKRGGVYYGSLGYTLPPTLGCILPLERASVFSYFCSHCPLSWNAPSPSLCAAVSPILQGPGRISPQPSSLVQSPNPMWSLTVINLDTTFPSVLSYSACHAWPASHLYVDLGTLQRKGCLSFFVTSKIFCTVQWDTCSGSVIKSMNGWGGVIYSWSQR